MNGYFLETDDYNAVILTDGKTAKVLGDGGQYEGVDLYAPGALEKLAAAFAAADLNDYDSIGCKTIVDYNDVANMLDDKNKFY